MLEMSTSLETSLQIPRPLFDEMLAQAVAELPNECCGLLAGRAGRVSHRYPLTNALASPVRYESDPQAMFAATSPRKCSEESEACTNPIRTWPSWTRAVRRS